MLISTFNTQLQKKYPQATAYVPDAYGKGKRQANQVNVTYSPNGKIYEYKGTILAIAERLNLIPEINCNKEASRLVQLILAGQEAIGYAGASDTIRYYLEQVGFAQSKSNWLDYTDAGLDEFDRPLCQYFISQVESKWL